jgi:hypothetical protein
MGPGAKCSTGQKRPNYSRKPEKRKEDSNTTTFLDYQRRRERDTEKGPDYQRIN